MKKAYILLALALVFVLCLSGCGKDSSGLTIMGKESDMDKEYILHIIDAYEKETGNDIKVVTFKDSEFEDEAEKVMKSKDAPDILMHFNNSQLDRFDVENNFKYMDDAGWSIDLTDGAKVYCTGSNGHLLGLPFWENSISGCYYNKRIFEKYGLEPAKTQKEFDALCKELKEKGITPVCWPGNGCSWMFQLGLDPVFDDKNVMEDLNSGKTTYADIKGVRDMIGWLDKAEKSGWFGDNYSNTGWEEIDDVMASGKAAMTFIWDTWFYTDFDAKGTYDAGDFGLMPVFMGTDDSGTYEAGNLNMMMVNKKGSNEETAEEFLDFCASQENYNAAFDGIATVSCFKNQTTNIESPMITEAVDSIMVHLREPVAVSEIRGYREEEMADAVNKLFAGDVDEDGCLKLMDEARIKNVENR